MKTATCRHCGERIVYAPGDQFGEGYWFHAKHNRTWCEPLPGFSYSQTRAEP